MDAQLAIDTLEKALERNPSEKGILLHSDQGSQYTSKAFTEFCEKKNIKPGRTEQEPLLRHFARIRVCFFRRLFRLRYC